MKLCLAAAIHNLKWLKITHICLFTNLDVKLFQAWIYNCHIHPLQAANSCRNSRLVVDEDGLKWLVN